MKELSIKAFEQHGFTQQGETGNQVYGICPFCNRDKHFYINLNNLNWDCKHCDREGGYQTFLKVIVKHCQKFFKGEIAEKLSKDKGIKVETLEKAGLGYNPKTNSYIIPVMSVDGKSIWDVRMYKIGGNFITTKGCKTALYGWDKMKSDTIWLCEGEWDALVMTEILKDNNIRQTVLAVQGASTFKGEWANIFRDKAVFVLYDNDDAGRKGAFKVYNNILGVIDSLKFVHWSEKYANGFDVRDYYKLKGSKTFKSLTSLMELYPQGAEITKEKAIEYTGEGQKPEHIYRKYSKWLKFPGNDMTVLDVIFGTIIANRLVGDPLWMFIVAPSGGMKSELLMSLFDNPEIFSASSITPHALISGANFGAGGDPSILPKLNKKVFIIKDFTVILNMNINDRDEIFSILRDAYDGRAEKAFGNGIFRAYKSKFGMLAGVTPIIEQYTEEHVALGERFLRYVIPISSDLDERMTMIFKAMDNVTIKDKMKKELLNIALKTLDYDFGNEPGLPDKIKKRIGYIAQWTSMLRSAVSRDKYTKEITDFASEELGTRLAGQFKKLLLGIALFRRIDTVRLEEYDIVKSIAINTIPRRSECILRHMYKHNKIASYSEVELADVIGLPVGTTRRLIGNLYMQKVLKKERLSSAKTNWSLTDGILEIMEIAEVYK